MPVRYNSPRGGPLHIAIVGVGRVGSCTSLLLVSEGIPDRLTLVDVAPGLSSAVARDLQAAAASMQVDVEIEAYTEASRVEGADIIVVTAGRPRRPGMKRIDLLKVNAEILREIADKIHSKNRDAVYLIVTNPVDIMAALFRKYTRGNVIGSGCHLDTLRFRVVLAEKLNVKPKMVEAYVGGGHGSYIVPLWSTVRVEGEKLTEWLRKTGRNLDKDEAREETVRMADHIIQKAGGTMLGPAAAFTEIIRAIAKDEGKTLSIATPHQIDGETIYLSRPTKVGKEIKVLHGLLTPEEEKQILNTGRKLIEALRKQPGRPRTG